MNNFWKIIFGSCFGTLLALGALILIVFGIAGAAGSGEDKVSVENNSVLEIKLTPELQIPEKTNNVSGDGGTFSFKQSDVLGLHDIIDAIKHAKNDTKIKGISIKCEGLMVSQATNTALRDALEDFRTSGKFVTAYAQYLMQKDYYLVSAADKIYLHPSGIMDFRGYSAQLTFMKNLLDKLDVKVQTYYAGQFKSATEPLRYEKMSDQNRLQTREYINGLYQGFLEKISTSRKVPVEDLRKYANGLMVRSADDAVNYKLVDTKGYWDEYLADIRQRMGLGEKDKINTISLEKYSKSYTKEKDYKTKNKIAVVFAEGSIVDGKGEQGSIGGEKYAEIIRKIRQEGEVKAIVMRVNSGGGSSMASECIWRELQLAKQAGIKIVCSMGTYAASGGYYIATPADSIFAEANTITGSIGVFSVVPSFEKTFKNKLGITFDTVKTERNSLGLGVSRDLNEEEGAYMQSMTDRIYEDFLQKVATSRHKTRDEIHAVAQGRVWLGTKAKEIGLVDKVGNLNDAIACAARLAGMDTYRVKEYPLVKDKFQQIMDEIAGKDDESIINIRQSLIKSELGEYYGYYSRLQSLKTMQTPQMRMYFDVEVK